MLEAKGRVIMVSGANRGIGQAVARKLHQKGYTLSLGARDKGKPDASVADIANERVMTHDSLSRSVKRFSRSFENWDFRSFSFRRSLRTTLPPAASSSSMTINTVSPR
jgi:NADP-dependent 3-hydroxy acid dehydrogenase YdfG